MPASSAATEIMNTPWSSSKMSSPRAFSGPAGLPSRRDATSDLPPRLRDQVCARVAVHDLRKLVHRVALLVGQRLGDLDVEAVVDVAAPAAGELFRALAAQSLDAAVRGAGRDPDALRALERRNLDGAAGDRLDDRDRDLDLEVVPGTLEHRRGRHVRHHVEIARGGAAGPGLALAGETDAAPLTHAGRDLHAEPLRLADQPGASAGRARIVDDCAAAAALGARLLDGEHALALGLDAAPVAPGTRAGRGARLGAAP